MGEIRGDGLTAVERRNDCDLVVTRTFNGPVGIVYDAWTKPELFKQWWAPKSSGWPMRACEMDVRTGGGYRVVFGHDDANSMAFFGKYIEVEPRARLVWTNEESEEAAITTVTFEDQGDKTRLVLWEHYPSKEALDEAFIGMEDSTPEQFRQLDELLISLGAGA